MIDYLDLKKSYIATIQMGLMLNTGYDEVKRGNELLHKFCESCVDNSNYTETDKQNMKCDLKILKETIIKEIELYFQST